MGEHVLREDMSNMSYRMTRLTGGHILEEVLRDKMSYGRTCLVGKHVIWEDMS